MPIDLNVLLTKIEKINFTVRTHNALKDAGYKIIAELVEIENSKDLLKIPNFGQKSLKEVEEYLKISGLNFGMNLIDIENYFGKSISELNGYLESLNFKDHREILSNFKNEKFDVAQIKEDPKIIYLSDNDPREKLLFIKLSEQEFSVRAKNYFSNNEIIYVGDLIQLSKKEVLRSNNMGAQTIEEIETFLKEINLTLDMNIDEWSPMYVNQCIEKYTYMDDPFNSFWEVALSENDIHDFSVLENKIISDLEKFYEKLNEREKVVFKNRLGYQDDILTLEELGNLFGVTRERIRQIESKIYKKIPFCRSVNDQKLKLFLLKYQYIGFAKIFPKLNGLFSNSDLKLSADQSLSLTNRSVINNYLIPFIEHYLDQGKIIFHTPEQTALNIFQNYSKIQSTFKDLTFPITKENFSYIVADTLRLEEESVSNSLSYLVKLEIIFFDENHKIYPIKITKRDEILAILNQYPQGIDNSNLFNMINSSPSKNVVENYHASFATGALDQSDYIFCGKSKIKAVQFGNFGLIDREQIFPLIIKYLTGLGGLTNLNDLFEHFRELLPKEVDIYDLRYLIKLEGGEFGIYFSGKSQGQTVSLGKKVSQNHKQEIEHKIKKSKNPLDLLILEETFSGVSQLLKVKLNELVYEGKICRFDINEWCSNKIAYTNINFNEFKKTLIEILNHKTYSTLTFITEKLNNDLNIYESRYFIESLIKKVNYDENLKINFSGEVITFSTSLKSMSKIIEENLDENLSIDLNYQAISNILNIGFRQYKQQFNHIKYFMKIKNN